MSTANAKKINEEDAPEGDSIQEILASGKDVGMRIWRNEEPGKDKPTVSRPYETTGYVLKGKAELHLGEKVIHLEEGDSYLVPKDTEHTYNILDTFTAVEATSPPAHLVK